MGGEGGYTGGANSHAGWHSSTPTSQVESLHPMVPSEFLTFFIASTGAAAALVGLLFVAVSLAPEQIVTRQAPIERQAVAGSAFTALVNAFFVSLVALIPHVNFGSFIVPLSGISLVTSLLQAWALLRVQKGWLSLLRRGALSCLTLGLYSIELRQGIGLLATPGTVGYVFGLVFVLLGILALGLTRAWELLGARRYSVSGWLNPLQEVPDSKTTRHEPPASGSPSLRGKLRRK
jgi:hypothetical protein